jgi:hypothetical protein
MTETPGNNPPLKKTHPESGGYFALWRGRSRQGAGIIDAATRGGLADLGQGVPVMMRS